MIKKTETSIKPIKLTVIKTGEEPDLTQYISFKLEEFLTQEKKKTG